MYAIIGTWKMSLEGVWKGREMLKNCAGAGDTVTQAVMQVEDQPEFHSVGYGGLPDREGRVTLDAGFMDGDSLRVGGVISVEHIKNPILAARLLCGRETNCLLSGRGAEEFALRKGLPLCDMRTQDSMERWRQEVNGLGANFSPYEGHDTVCVLALDHGGHMAAGVSTSGLFMKEIGRVGDSPLAGCGFFCDSRYGAAAATGLGEDIMRGCLSYEAVSLMRRGASPQDACREALKGLVDRKLSLKESKGSISLIALSPRGEFGASTTLPLFPFSFGSGDHPARLYRTGWDQPVQAAREEDLKGLD